MHTYVHNLFFYFPEPHTFIIGEPDMYVDIGSMLNLSCVVSYTERPPVKVSWLHNGIEISFRGPRSGVSVSHHVSSNVTASHKHEGCLPSVPSTANIYMVLLIHSVDFIIVLDQGP